MVHALAASIIFLSCVHTSSESSSSSALSSQQKWNELTRWVRAEGGFVHPSLHAGKKRHGDFEILGITTNETLKAGTVLFELPEKLLISLELFNLDEEYDSLVSAPLLASCNSSHVKSDIEKIKLAMILAMEQQKGAQSPYSRYLDLLPRRADVEQYDMLYAENDLLKRFEQLPLVNFWHKLYIEKHGIFSACFDELKALLPHGNLLWTDVAIVLRLYESRYFDFIVQHPDGPRKREFLAPACDMVNTGTPENFNVNTQTYVDPGFSGRDRFQLEASKDIEIGEELINNYCDQCDNERFMAQWSMYLEHNAVPLNNNSMIDCRASIPVDAATGLPERALHAEVTDMLDLTMLEDLGGVLSPRCRNDVKEGKQGPLVCNLARLLWETCAQEWGAASPRREQEPDVAERFRSEHGGARHQLAQLLHRRGDHDGAESAYQDLINLDLGYRSMSNVHLDLASLRRGRGNLTAAEESCRNALKLSPSNARALEQCEEVFKQRKVFVAFAVGAFLLAFLVLSFCDGSGEAKITKADEKVLEKIIELSKKESAKSK